MSLGGKHWHRFKAWANLDEKHATYLLVILLAGPLTLFKMQTLGLI